MAILTNSGRAAIALAIKNNPIYMAWGLGNNDWDGEGTRESRTATMLSAEIGRVRVKSANFCVPDQAGDIVMQGARFSISSTPTPNLHLRGEFDFSDGLGQTIREIGIFVNTIIKSGLPKGQRYFVPENLDNKGILLALDHITPLNRGVGSRVSFDFVISF